MDVPEEIRDRILYLKAQMYSKGSIVRDIKSTTRDKILAQKYVAEVLSQRTKVLVENPRIYKDEGKKLIITGLVITIIPIIIVVIFPDFLIFRFAIVVGPIFILLGILKYFGIMK